jgi:hypothetical protein
MSTFRAFQTGLEAGQQQAKVRRQDDARRKATEAYGMGNYEGAVTGLMSEGMTQEANDFDAMRQRDEARKKQQAIATALGRAPDQQTGMQNVRKVATEFADPDMIMRVDEWAKNAKAEELEQFNQSINFLAQTAMGLKNVAPEKRAQEAIAALQNSPYANPQVMAQIERAGADGLITNKELDDFVLATMSVKDRLEMAKSQKADYVESELSDGTYFVNKNDPTDKVRIGSSPPKSGGGDGLSTYQGLQFQLKLDDLDRELSANEKKRQMDLSTVDNSITLLDKFVGDQGTFNEVYGNWINPTGEGNDMLNPRVQPGSKRANGRAILEQIGGRAFLDSIGAMRGTGPLSDREGAKVGAAATRLMNVEQDDAAAATAAQEFRGALVAYKRALEQDIQNSRASEAARRQQVEAMMGRPPSAAPKPAQAPQQAEDDEDNAFLDKLFGNFDQIAKAAAPSAADMGDDDLKAMLGLD